MGSANTTLRDMKASAFLGKFGENSEFFNADSEGIKDFLEYLKDELLKENNDLKIKLEMSLEEIDKLKSNNLDNDEKETKIVELTAKLDKLEKTKSTNQYETEFARISTEYAILKSNQVYYINVIREILKVIKKQKHELASAIHLLNDSDAKEITNILKAFKISY